MTIEIHVSNDNGDVVASIVKSNYDALTKEIVRLKPLIKDLEKGQSGILVCAGCNSEYLYGEDKRVDAGLICVACAKDIG